MIYYSKALIKHELSNAKSVPDYIDIARLHTLYEKPLYKTHTLNIPEYMIKEYNLYWKQYALFWLFNYHMILNEQPLYTPYFWNK